VAGGQSIGSNGSHPSLTTDNQKEINENGTIYFWTT